MSITIGSLFAGIGGFELGLERAIPGAQTIWQVEQNEYCQRILKKHWPHAQLFNDVCEVGAHNLSPVDILCGGFPCQNITNSGKKEGIHGEKSSLWFEMRRIISELRPPIIILENVAAITFRGLSSVLADLAALRYDAEWCIVSARDFGAPHLRERWFCVAYTMRARSEVRLSEKRPQQERYTAKLDHDCDRPAWRKRKSYWSTQPRVCRVVDGLPNRAHRLRALGNAIVPQCSQWIGEQVLASGLLTRHVYLEPRADYDACIIDVKDVVTYSADMIIEMLMQKQGWSYDDALEWFCYNIETPQSKDWPLFVWEE